MVKHTQAIRRLLLFDRFVGLALKRLKWEKTLLQFLSYKIQERKLHSVNQHPQIVDRA